ncbi:FAD dependent oxidoreductase [Penicillium waksmanii]|uniref:FAD dependent oxidoreductase n=1 Tax=Penicillium waksmanii TaxID=69791 RepID=UPI002548BF69|nr:FAD dependent oxidoreductase [Penicillium waksmanii]KAJ5979627.1 FAD dependent oxidoreductase [Penicillium waksmanii]
MSTTQFPTTPSRDHYDVVIIGGATSGSSIAWHLVNDKSFSGSVLVIERDPSLQFSATKASNNCMRQQFATKINVEIAQYAAGFVKNFGLEFGDDPCVPTPPIRDFGYLYLSDSKKFTEILREDQQLQSSMGAGTQILSADDVKCQYPFIFTEDLDSASLNTKDEGCFNAIGMVNWMRMSAVKAGVDYINNEVVEMMTNGDKTEGIKLRSGDRISAKNVVNAAGTCAAQVAKMAGIKDLPIEARRRYTYIFSVDEPIPQDLPLTIDPTGVHVRSYGPKDYLVGCPPIGPDIAVDVDDLSFAENAWEEKILPIITRRIPQFKTARVTNAWMGHYEFNTFDHNAVIGPHSVMKNFYFCVGFSGHGSQQAPACGRAVAELIVHGAFKSLDLGTLSYSRIPEGRPLMERAVI